jgi:hypothetical protein
MIENIILEDFTDLSDWIASTEATLSLDPYGLIILSGSNGSSPGITKNVNYDFQGNAPTILLYVNINDLPSNLVGLFVYFFNSDGNDFNASFVPSELEEGLNLLTINPEQWVQDGDISWEDIITSIKFRLFIIQVKMYL